MIILFGYGDDPCLAAVARAASELGAAVLLIDQQRAAGVELVLRFDRATVAAAVTVDGLDYRLEEWAGAYARPLTPPEPPGGRGWQHGRMLHAGLVEWLDLTELPVLNRPGAMLSNASKPLQSQLIGAAGFEVPATLVTNDPEAVRRFWHQHGEVIFKSTSGIRSIVRRLDAAASRRLALVRDLPTQFQQFVEGTDIRVHVVGEQVYATEIQSEAVDYRYARADGLDAVLTGVELPAAVSRQCLRLAAALALPFCGIDLRRRSDGSYVCFEVNPMPGFSYYEAHTGQPISRAVCELLLGKAR
jgi:hypothetical protein